MGERFGKLLPKLEHIVPRVYIRAFFVDFSALFFHWPSHCGLLPVLFSVVNDLSHFFCKTDVYSGQIIKCICMKFPSLKCHLRLLSTQSVMGGQNHIFSSDDFSPPTLY